MRPRVFVHGVGAITPLGASWPETCAALAEGRSAIGPVRAFDAAGFPCTVAAEALFVPRDGRDRRLALALPAAREAWAQARAALSSMAVPARAAGQPMAGARVGAEPWALSRTGEDRGARGGGSRDLAGPVLGIFVGAESGRASMRTLLGLAAAAGPGSFDRDRFAREARELAPALQPAEMSPAAVAAALAVELHAQGPVETISLACASGSAAIAEASRALRLGECDVALCGGVGADVDPFMLAGFGLLGALSARGVSRPFDAHRDGFVLGEGAAFAVLSREPGEVELAGEARSLDAHHLTAPAPDGGGALRAMHAALLAAELDRVDVVQAHGTSTQLNDAIEAAALRQALPLDGAHVSSVKGALGHTVAAAGALGFLCAVEALRSGTVLPTAGLAEPDCALPHVLGRAIRRDVRSALVNSFAFGGANCSLVLRRA